MVLIILYIHCKKQNLTYLNVGIPLRFLSESCTGEQSPLFSQVREKLYWNKNMLYCLSGYCHYDHTIN